MLACSKTPDGPVINVELGPIPLARRRALAFDFDPSGARGRFASANSVTNGIGAGFGRFGLKGPAHILAP